MEGGADAVAGRAGDGVRGGIHGWKDSGKWLIGNGRDLNQASGFNCTLDVVEERDEASRQDSDKLWRQRAVPESP